MAKYKNTDFIGKAWVAVIVFFAFGFGFATGGWFVYKTLNIWYYDEMREADSALWVRIYAIDGDKADVMERVDRLARAIDRYDLAVAQIVAYENRQEIMNVRVSDED